MKTTTNAKAPTAATTLLTAGFMVMALSADAAPLRAGDIVYADSFAALIKVDPATGERSVLASGGNLVMPYGVAQDRQGNLLVSDTGAGAIIRINTKNGRQTVVAKGGALGSPYGIAVDRHGMIYVANAQTVLSVNPITGVASPLASAGSNLQVPLGVTVATDGNLYIADAVTGIIRLNPQTRVQTVVSQDAGTPCGITMDTDSNLLVTDVANGRVRSLDAQTGAALDAQRMIGESSHLVCPVGLALDGNGSVLISDPDAADLAGAVFRLGDATPITTGSGDYVNPRGMTIITR